MKSEPPRKRFHGSSKIIFVTGTDTGAGKTLLAGLLLHHCRHSGCHALGMKPFCSGGRDDVVFLSSVQNHELPMDEINPFYFAEPIAPLVAARKRRRAVRLSDVLDRIRRLESKCDRLIIEGAGGVLVPLGEGYSVLDVIAFLRCQVVVAARNKLGMINHTLLTVKALQAVGIKSITVILMGCRGRDVAVHSNQNTLQELLSPITVLSIPFLGEDAVRLCALKNNYKKTKKTIALLPNFDTFDRVLLNDSKKRLTTKPSVDSARSRK
ncbi:MAG: dethiobiotin synthase [Verrucomicrobia bacterium]|nr:dethiobiotin synthase [Verrucomicrobiota bacterium]